MAYDAEKTIRVIPFGGKHEDWPMWSKKFLARSRERCYKEVLLGTSEEATTDEAKLKLRLSNEKAYTDLLLSCSDEVSFGAVEEAVTDELPDGDAKKAWANLVAKYEPKTSGTLVLLKKEFFASKMESAEADPDEWIASLERTRQRLRMMKSVVTDEDLMIHILNNLPKDYDAIVEQLEDDLAASGPNKLTLERVRDKLRIKFQRLHRDDAADQKETALAAGNFLPKFKGLCRVCGKQGHKGSDCWQNKNKGSGQSTANTNPTGGGRGNGGGGNGNGGRRNGGGRGRFDGKCFYCGKTGHRISECRQKQQHERANVATEEAEVVLASFASPKVDSDLDVWIGDTGATQHMTYMAEGMYDLVAVNREIKIGDGKKLHSVHEGKLKVTVVQLNGKTVDLTLSKVQFVPGLCCNLFSMTQAMQQGFHLSSTANNCLKIKKAGTTLTFDRKISTLNGFILGVELKRKSETALVGVTTRGGTVKMTELHNKLGHPGVDKLRATAAQMNLKLIGTMDSCEDCALAKARQKNIPKLNPNRSSIPGERLYLDISGIKAKSMGGNKYWVLIVDDATGMKWSFFLKLKDELPASVMPFLQGLRASDTKKVQYIFVRFIRCDNAGENLLLEKECKKQGLGIAFEYSSAGTPQQNGVVERAFATLWGRVRAMMNHAHFPRTKRDALWCECAATATKLDNILCDTTTSLYPHKCFYGDEPKYARNLRIFGEIGVVADHATKMIRAKLTDRGKTCMFVGYADNHAGDVYRMLDLKTNRVVISRDLTWLNKVYGVYAGITGTQVVHAQDKQVEEDEAEDDDTIHTSNKNWASDHDMVEEVQPEPEPARGIQPVSRMVRELDTSYNPVLSRQIDSLVEDLEQAEVAFFGKAIATIEVACMSEDYTEPPSFAEAWDHVDKTERDHWRAAIKKEINSMIEKRVWKQIEKEGMPSDRKAIGSKWVLKKRKNGIYRARLVALGYSQVPGIDFTDSFAPVVHDATFRIVLLLWIVKGWGSTVLDVETAFLYGELKEDIFMKVPNGLPEYLSDKQEVLPDNCVLHLQKSIYGLVQAARQWWARFTDVLTQDMGFERSLIDPCMLHRQRDNGELILCLYVDDILCVGNDAEIEQLVIELGRQFTIKNQGPIDEYVGCKIVSNTDRTKVWLTQPDLIKKLEGKFGPTVAGMQRYATPAGPGEIIMRPQDPSELIDVMEQYDFRSGVGMLLYLVKHSRPDISNAVRELSKVMDGATAGHVKSLHRAIKFVLDTKDQALCLAPNMNLTQKWELHAYSDSDFAGDRDKRRSVSGYIIFLAGAPIIWRSKSQRSVTLSSTEAEYVAVSEVCAEIMFVKQVMEFLHIPVKLPIVVHVDNVGAIFLANNATTGQRTRHIDVRHHYVREYIEDNILAIRFVKSEDNDGDPYTKNTTQEIFKKHTGKYMATVHNREGVGD